MALTISKRCMAIAPSVTLAIDTKAKEMKAQGIDVIGFGVGEPDFDTPEYICEAAKKAIDAGMTRYTPVAGTMALRKAIAAKLKDLVVKIPAKAGAGGRLFGAVTSKEVSDALKAQHNVTIAKAKIVQDEPIKSFGAYQLKCKLGYEIVGTVHVEVVEG